MYTLYLLITTIINQHISPKKRLQQICKTASLLRFPISVGREPDVNYIAYKYR
jgi:hypothetical protein